MDRGIGTSKLRIGNREELIGNETQFNTVKGLIGSTAFDLKELSSSPKDAVTFRELCRFNPKSNKFLKLPSIPLKPLSIFGVIGKREEVRGTRVGGGYSNTNALFSC
ncbi:hypothetical protein [Sporosarcina sp. D27]|uniref:hypothetical protein n=1 Tax=Sporosarcina sp. D27 TaxID=1382305 RepID=UPI0012DFDF6A|nr:hypothetical protein [Sporosarcina sp. D27]